MLAAIDIGGTFLKSGIADGNSRTVSHVERHVGCRLRIGKRGEVELDPYELISSVRRIVRQLVRQFPQTSGLLLTGQMHGWALTNDDGSPASPIVTWRDSFRSKSEGLSDSASPLETVSELLGSALIRRSGNELRMGIPAVSLFERVRDGLPVRATSLNSLTSFVANQLTETCPEPIIHITDAAALGMVNLSASEWDSEIIGRLGIGDTKFPRIVDVLTTVGRIPGLGIPVYTAIGDQQAALLGTGLAQDELSLNIATGSQVSRIVEKPIEDCQIRPYFANTYLATFTHIPAGRALNAFVDALARFYGISESEVWTRAIQECDALIGKSPLAVTPTFFESPYGRSGLISGLNESSFDISFVFAGAIDWMVDVYRDCATKLDPHSKLKDVAVTGGLGIRVPYLRRRLITELQDRNLRFFNEEDASLMGLAALANKSALE